MTYSKFVSTKMVALATIFALVWGSFLPSYIALAQEGGETPPPVEQQITPPAENPAPPPAEEAPPTETSSLNSDSNEPGPGEDGANGTPSESGQTGGDGLNGGEQAPPEEQAGSSGEPSSTPAEITTGDASSQTDATNSANTNTLAAENPPPSDRELNKFQQAMCRKFPEGNPKRPKYCPTTPETVITAGNDATVAADSTTEAGTGANTVDGQEGSALIDTGNAFAGANAINVVNTNIINSSGMLLFMNLLFGGNFDFRTLDLSYFFGQGGGGSGGCTFTQCGGSDTTVNVDNTATVLNSMIVRAQTGGNTCEGDAGCTIDTGNAYAAGNAVNLVNSNIIDSNYLLVSFNAFGDMGDIILPGADFFAQLLAQSNSLSGSLDVNANNTAAVTDGTAATAASGDNTATSTEGTADIDTGNAVSSATAYNQVNSNLIGGTQVFFLFRIWGDWGGSITGLPEGMSWAETPYGIELFNENGSPASTNALAGNCCAGSDLTVNATNTAQVTNNVEVYALTGDNRAESASSTAEISTGNAYASANSVNIVNTNLIGRNWVFAIFNIFGNFTGNISFGQPDLWIGATAETGNPTLPGSDVTYHFTVSNMGDADATNVKLAANFVKEMLYFEGADETDSGALWNLGTIKKGETKEFVYNAFAGLVPDGSSVAVPLTATLSSLESDSNPSNNTEQLDIVVMNPTVTYTHSGPGNSAYTPDPKITMQKVSHVVATSAPALVDYAIIIQNDGGNAYDVKVKDTLIGPLGYVGDQSWSLGTVKSGEEVRIEYTVQFGADIAPGLYTNTAILTGTKNSDVNVYATSFSDITAENKLEIRPRGEVLGEQIEALPDAPQCEPYLTSYIRPGRANASKEVTKLQKFLMVKEGEAGLRESGRYDKATIAAVKRFQQKYMSDILSPWGISKPTGSVYYTTQRKINNLMCDGTKQFDLSQEQVQEIEGFRGNVPNLPSDYDYQNVGGNPDPEPTAAKPKPVPALPAVFKLPPPAPATSTESLLPKWLKNLMFSALPFVEAMER